MQRPKRWTATGEGLRPLRTTGGECGSAWPGPGPEAGGRRRRGRTNRGVVDRQEDCVPKAYQLEATGNRQGKGRMVTILTMPASSLVPLVRNTIGSAQSASPLSLGAARAATGASHRAATAFRPPTLCIGLNQRPPLLRCRGGGSGARSDPDLDCGCT